MKLNTNSWHYKLWDNSFGNDYRPKSTDLCHYCHRVFWQIVYYAMLGSMIAAIVVFGLYAVTYFLIYQAFCLHTKITLIAAGALIVVFTMVVSYAYWFSSDTRLKAEPNTLLGKWLSAKKQKVCPLVEFDEE